MHQRRAQAPPPHHCETRARAWKKQYAHQTGIIPK